MPRQKRPTYQLHKATGQAKVRLGGKDFYLGKYGSQESRERYRQLLSQHALELDEDQVILTIGELSLAYFEYVKTYYVKRGEPTSEMHVIRSALRPLLRRYKHHFAHKFRRRYLCRLRDEMVPLGWKRTVINRALSQIRRMFNWAAEKELIPGRVARDLKHVRGLKKDRTTAPESVDVQPVNDSVVEATLPFLSKIVGDMIRVQRLTGMRPGEVCQLCPQDVNREGEIWLYEPRDHKMIHLDEKRRIWIGPRAQEILTPYLQRPADQYCFSPTDAEQDRRQQKHMRRVTPLRFGNRPGTHRQPQPRRSPQNRYTTQSYARAIKRACELAYQMPDRLRRPPRESTSEELTKFRREATIWRKQNCWSPNRLRHTAGTLIRKLFDLDAAQVTLGHADAETTERYAKPDDALAIKVARTIG